jgi:ActR/RegA family two-component response regulator
MTDRRMDRLRSPDIVLLSVDWHTRAPLRAQLIEEGFEVLATDTWPMMREMLRPGAKPRLAIVDLQGLPNPREVLDGLRVLMKPDRVLVLTALGSVAAGEIEPAGFRALRRPTSIDDVVRAAKGVDWTGEGRP